MLFAFALDDSAALLDDDVSVLEDSTMLLEEGSFALDDTATLLDDDVSVLEDSTMLLDESSFALDDSTTLLDETRSILDEDSSSLSTGSEVVHAAKKKKTNPTRSIFKGTFFMLEIYIKKALIGKMARQRPSKELYYVHNRNRISLWTLTNSHKSTS
jgi:hypothetical protein